MRFKTVQFIHFSLHTKHWSHKALPEMAVIGRSNVGKSSLINHLLYSKNVAKVSSTPGKTQHINCFLIDNLFYIVDFPGYGYAKTPKILKKEWAPWIETYLQEHPIKLILLLIDSRRGFSQNDHLFLQWADQRALPLFPIMTKSDKLSKKARDEKTYFLYSTKEGECRAALIRKINDALWD